MARKEFKGSTHVLIVVVLLFSMFHCKEATRIGSGCAIACHVEAGTGKQKHVHMQDYSGDEPGPGDYDYYRRYGDVPSPGAGH